MENLLRDVRHGLTLLWKEKAFSLTVLLTLAVCVGANATIFSVVNKVLLEPLPYADADRLVVIYNSYPGAGVPRASNGSVDFFQRRERVEAFQEIAQYQQRGHTVGEAGSTERVQSLRVTPSFFPMLEVRPVLGRLFLEEEMRVGNEEKVVLSHGYWRERFSGDPAAVGRDLRVDGRPYTIVGVLPESFRAPLPEQPRIYVPIPYAEDAASLDNWHNNNYEMMARLRPGVSIERARAESDALNATLIAEWPIPNAAQLLADAGFHTQIHPAQEEMVREIRPALALLWAGVVFVLLIGCVNIANIILARSQVRVRDMATRLALGAPRVRLAREQLTHALVLALAGGLIGIGVAAVGIRFLGTLGVDQLPRGADIGLDLTVLLFTLAVAVVAGLLFGALPLTHLLRRDLRGALGTESRGGTADRRALWVRSGLVTAQVALAFLLLIGAGLMLASFRAASSVDPGFRAQGVWTGNLSLPASRYPDGGDRIRFLESVLAEVRALPGVASASLTTTIPFGGNNNSSVILPEGYVPPPGESILSPYFTVVMDDYFETLGIPLLEGRTFRPEEGADDRRVLIIDEWLARRYYGEESPLGRRMVWGAIPGQAEEDDLYTIIGVVGTVKQNDLTRAPEEHVGAYYLPYRLNPWPFATLVARSEAAPEALTSAIRERVTRLDPELPVHGVLTLEQRLEGSLLTRRTTMLLLLGFAGLALLLAVLGIYGVLAYLVAQRTREMGIRMAMGSTARDLFLLVVGRGARVAGLGLAVGVLAALVLGQLIRSLLFQVAPLEPAVLAAVGTLLAAVAIAACVVPAWQATRIDPVRALVGE